jgi:predicted RNA-binding protein with TRAM domain
MRRLATGLVATIELSGAKIAIGDTHCGMCQTAVKIEVATAKIALLVGSASFRVGYTARTIAQRKGVRVIEVFLDEREVTCFGQTVLLSLRPQGGWALTFAEKDEIPVRSEGTYSFRVRSQWGERVDGDIQSRHFDVFVTRAKIGLYRKVEAETVSIRPSFLTAHNA